MSIWTMEQVSQARGLYARAHVDDEQLHRHPEMGQAVAAKLCRKLVEMAHPFVIEIDPADVVIEVTDAATHAPPFTRQVDARWAPQTNGVILRGGPRDGERWAVQRVGEPLRVEVLLDAWVLNDDQTVVEAAITTAAFTYQLAGWHETERLWVYEVSTLRQ